MHSIDNILISSADKEDYPLCVHMVNKHTSNCSIYVTLIQADKPINMYVTMSQLFTCPVACNCTAGLLVAKQSFQTVSELFF